MVKNRTITVVILVLLYKTGLLITLWYRSCSFNRIEIKVLLQSMLGDLTIPQNHNKNGLHHIST
jgi:hypothetical protein